MPRGVPPLSLFTTMARDERLFGKFFAATRAERFWEQNGYIETRRRYGVVMRNATHTVRVMIKPLSETGLGEYLHLVSRDHPNAP